MSIGVITDTYAGDVGPPNVLTALAEPVPVTAMRGSNDRGPWSRAIAAAEVVDADGVLIYVLHDVEELDLDPVAAGFRLVCRRRVADVK